VNKAKCSQCDGVSMVDDQKIHYCRSCYLNRFGFGIHAVKEEPPSWMEAFKTRSEVVKREYFVEASPRRSSGDDEICICSPNPNDTNRDCAVHPPDGITFGLEPGELRRGGLE
jgi:hypothetical protein